VRSYCKCRAKARWVLGDPPAFFCNAHAPAGATPIATYWQSINAGLRVLRALESRSRSTPALSADEIREEYNRTLGLTFGRLTRH
jgi:hypothetical protein